MAGGGSDAQKLIRRRRRRQRRGNRQKAASLPLDIIIAEIAARSDPATLVRCAATCRDARRRIAKDPSLLGRLRLRDTERFVPSLLRGHLTGFRGFCDCNFKEIIEVDMVDITTAADTTRLVQVTFAEAGETLSRFAPMDSRGGLVLVRDLTTATTTQNNNTDQRQLLVCNMATRRFTALPPEPAIPDPDAVQSKGGAQYVLLAGGINGEGAGAGADTIVGRPFQVLKLEMSPYSCLLVHTFSSEHGVWSPLTKIPIANLHGSSLWWYPRPLVVGDVAHWLCLTDVASYMMVLHVGAARVNVMALPASFPRDDKNNHYQYLLAAASAGGNPIVLVADADRISAWEPQAKHTSKMWKPQPPQVVIEKETILGFKDDGLAKLVEKEKEKDKGERRRWERKPVLELLWFAERSGIVLLRFDFCLLWLDLHSKKIVRCFSSDRLMRDRKVYCPYEMDLSSWVPTTFSSAVTL